ncbi:hypothetical protein B0A52_07692 [Exophiala mesophila]|uniref:polynucleotide adenylyltransferase n=1 Tax=Exophiala mesophila TaxID=212818 RepID=A0A438MYI3_EXOME|nr:hypothetical protein B0A52_07692 [Exophiala mesophila]
MTSSQSSTGFPEHLTQQLQEISRQQQQQQPPYQHSGRGSYLPRGQPSYQTQNYQRAHYSSNLPEDFPPLGTANPAPSRSTQNGSRFHETQSAYPSTQQFQSLSASNNNYRHGSPREFQDQARANYRGRQSHYNSRQQFVPQQSQSTFSSPYNRRGGRVFNPNAGLTYGTPEQQQAARHQIMKQSDYLMAVGRKPYLANKLQREESIAKDEFRLELERVAIDALTTKYPGLDASKIKLKCYGSLANGFGLAGCDMDLLLSLPDYPDYKAPITTHEGTIPDHVAIQDQSDTDAEKSSFKSEVQRVLEKAFLDRGYGARLLTKTRVPILRMCQSPSAELLQNLRDHQLAEEHSAQEKRGAPKSAAEPDQHPVSSRITKVSGDVTESVASALDDLTIADSDPPVVSNSKSRGNAGLEFVGDVGIQCDINFGNFVALHNSALLRTYHTFDSRVGDLGIFVKIWAKTRDINTPYLGTLSSYGYILMVLHYLMNIVNPPIIPNLQALAKKDDGWYPERPVPLFEGFDVRFLQTSQDIQNARSQLPRNNESVGQLLRGFFKYYGTREGFHWTRDVISIREPGGQLTKAQKGWTEAKWAENSSNQVRLRYLMAIEDPFEVEHNVARTVGHHGIVAIRDEFRRAWSIIERVGTNTEAPIEELLTPVTDRGDTLRRDQDFHRQRQLQMKQELEARERALLQKVDDEDPDANTDGMSGTSKVAQISFPPDHAENHHHPPPRARLTSITSPQAYRRQTGVLRRCPRQIKMDSDGEDEGDNRDESLTLASSDMGSAHSEAQTTPESLKSKNGLQSRTGGGGNLSLLHDPPKYGVDANGNIIPWDVDDQDGRWLHWRDVQIRRGAKLQISNPTLRDLHENNPYEPNRPNPYLEKPYNNRFEGREHRKVSERPPWPAPNVMQQNSTDELDGYPEDDRNGVVDNMVSNAGAEKVETPGNIEPQDVRMKESNLKWAADQHDPHYSRSDSRFENTGEWDTSLQDGRWLSWRDDLIRKGLWIGPPRKPWLSKLNELFPHSSERTSAEWDAMNEELRERERQKRQVRAAAAKSKRHQRQQQEHALDQALRQGPRKVSSPESSQSRPKRVISYENKSWDDIAQHGYHDHGLIAQDTHFVTQGDANVSTAPEPHNDRLSAPQSHHEEEDSHPDSAFVRAQRLAFFVKSGRAKLSAKSISSSRSESAEVMDEQSRGDDREEQHVNGGPTLEMARTLEDQAEGSEIPPEDDPRIMPIPQRPGFQFDPRQIEDLSIIARGGNGCARAGAHFSIEEDYEWGGGGMMGYRKSTSSYEGYESASTADEVFGKGDEEGLLEELPREVDSYER